MISAIVGCAVASAFVVSVLYKVNKLARRARALEERIESGSNQEGKESVESLGNAVVELQARLNTICVAIDDVQKEAKASVDNLRKECVSAANAALEWKKEGFARLDAHETRIAELAGRHDGMKKLVNALRECFDDLAERFDKIEKEHEKHAKTRNFAVDAFYKTNLAVRDCLKEYEEATNENATI